MRGNEIFLMSQPRPLRSVHRSEGWTPETVLEHALPAICLLYTSDAAAHITGQIFAVRGNEIFLMSQPRPLRSVHRSEGWTPETVLEHALPAMQRDFYGPETSRDVFNWDPI